MLNNIKADAILEAIFDSSGYEFTEDTIIFRQWLQDQAYKLKGITEYTYIDNMQTEALERLKEKFLADDELMAVFKRLADR